MADFSPSFQFLADQHGRFPSALRPSGGTLNVVTGAASNGDYLPGAQVDMLTRPTVLRIAATKDSRIRFTRDAGTADSTDILFQSGTEVVPLPYNTNYISAITEDGTAGKLCVTVLQ